MTPPLNLRFASNHVTLDSESGHVRDTLAHYLKNCLGRAGTAVAHYRIIAEEPGWCLHRDDWLLVRTGQPDALYEPWLQDALAQLIAPEAAHLIFHAGGIARGAFGIMICGQTAVGKSTLTAQLVLAGLNYLTDEAVALAFPEMKMVGFCRPLVLKNGSAFIWESSSPAPGLLLLPGGSTWLTPDWLRGDCAQATAVPRLILFPVYNSEGVFSVRLLSPAESAFHLLQHLVNAENWAGNGLTAVSQVAQRIPAFALSYQDGTAVVAWLQNYLASLTE